MLALDLLPRFTVIFALPQCFDGRLHGRRTKLGSTAKALIAVVQTALAGA
jgi:hypothetical protein